MEVTFLGTGTSQGVPVIACDCNVCKSEDPHDNRLRSSVMIDVREKRFIIDTGPDFRFQMLRENVQSIDAVLLTHGHKDHIGGLDDVRAFNFKLKRHIDIYARNDVIDQLKKEFGYAFGRNKYPGVPQINMNEIHNEPFTIGSIPIIPIEVVHYKMPVFGFRIGGFSYITDLSYISYEEKRKLIGSKVLVVTALRKQKHYSHFNLEEAIELVNEIKPEKAYFTHISHLLGLHEDVSKELPENMYLAYDGLKIEI